MIILLIVALVARHRRAHRPPAADSSNCITGRPCTRGCSLFCALEHHRAVTS